MPSYRLFPLLLLACLASACSPLRQPLAERVLAPRLDDSAAVMADGYRLPLSVWGPSRAPVAVIVALHGFNDYRRAFAGTAAALADSGIATYAVDQRGFGESRHRGIWPGAATLAADARELATLVRARHPGVPLYLLGESMGGAVALLAAEQPGLAADGLILLAPALWNRDSMPWYQRTALWLAARLLPGWTPTGESLERWPSDNIEMLRALAADPLVIKATRIDTVEGLVNLMDAASRARPPAELPLLLLYGLKDQIIPRAPICRFLDRLPESGAARAAFYADGYHMLTRDLQRQRVLGDLAAWILAPADVLPSRDVGLSPQKPCRI